MGKQATHWTRLSCHRFRANEVRLQLSVLAYNLGNLWRRLVLPTRIERWSLTSLQQRLVKTGGRLVKHARYYWLFLAESHLTRRLFGAMLQQIWALPVPAGSRAASARTPAWQSEDTNEERCRRNPLEARTSSPRHVSAGWGDGIRTWTMVRRTQSRGLGGSRVYKWPSWAGKTEIPANR